EVASLAMQERCSTIAHSNKTVFLMKLLVTNKGIREHKDFQDYHLAKKQGVKLNFQDMEKLNFFIPVHFDPASKTLAHSLLEIADHYFYLGGKQACVLSSESEQKDQMEVKLQSAGPPS